MPRTRRKLSVTPDTECGYRLHAAGLSRSYTSGSGLSITALDGVGLDLPPGSVTAIAGPSGSGKSTLLHLLGGMDRPNAGTVHADGIDITKFSWAKLAAYRRTVGFVFQHFALLPALTAKDNVLLPLLPYRTDFDRHHVAGALLADVGLEGREDALPSQLSGGQRQRVAIARALINSPRLLVADEPTGNLDSATGADILDQLLRLRDEHVVTVVIATHDAELSRRCDQIIHLRDGRLNESSA